MNMKKFAIILFLLGFVLFSIPPVKTQAQATNAGFVPGNIWYSKDPLEERDKIKIYTLIFNPDARELSGTVIFFDQSVFLGKKDFIAPAKGVKDVSIDWTVTVGEHKIFGKIENAKFLISKGKYEEVYLVENKTEESTRTVNKKIIVDPGGKSESQLESIKNIGKIIEEKTPEFITKPIISTTSTIEKFRADIGAASASKKAEVQDQIKVLGDVEENKFLKPFKYVELFLFSLFSFIFNNKFIFYVILVFAISFLLRYIVKRVR